MIKLMFPETVREPRKRAGVVSEIDVFKGVFYWQKTANGSVLSKGRFLRAAD